MKLTRRGLFKLGAGLAAAGVVGVDKPTAISAPVGSKSYGVQAGRAMAQAHDEWISSVYATILENAQEIREFSGVVARTTTKGTITRFGVEVESA